MGRSAIRSSNVVRWASVSSKARNHRRSSVLMLRTFPGVIAIVASCLLPTITSAAAGHGKRHLSRPWHGYGFLPGYRSPEQIERENAWARGPVYWYGGPGFYRGRAGFTFQAHPHMLRHACGYKLANDGVDTRALQHYLGHKNIQHTVRYTELAPDRFKGFWKD
jgi:hypothetical protein